MTNQQKFETQPVPSQAQDTIPNQPFGSSAETAVHLSVEKSQEMITQLSQQALDQLATIDQAAHDQINQLNLQQEITPTETIIMALLASNHQPIADIIPVVNQLRRLAAQQALPLDRRMLFLPTNKPSHTDEQYQADNLFTPITEAPPKQVLTTTELQEIGRQQSDLLIDQHGNIIINATGICLSVGYIAEPRTIINGHLIDDKPIAIRLLRNDPVWNDAANFFLNIETPPQLDVADQEKHDKEVGVAQLQTRASKN